MKYLKLFESHKSGIKDEDYFNLVDTLQTEIFDEYNMVELNDEEFEEYFEEENSYPYWEYSYNIDSSIRQINICCLSKENSEKIIKELEEIRKIVYGRTSIKYSIYDFIEDGINYIKITII